MMLCVTVTQVTNLMEVWQVSQSQVTQSYNTEKNIKGSRIGNII